VKTAAIYRRISRDPDGLREGVTRQDEDTRALAVRLGVEIVAEFEDNDTGASTLSRKPRPQYDAMVEAARAGEFRTILAYSNSRLTRRMRELEDLLDLHDQHGVQIHTVVSGSDDLATADGRMTARIKASVDAAEAERTGERLQRAFLAKAQQGTVNQGGRPFGWQADKITLDPAESALVREAVADVLDGVGLREIVRRWNDAGVTTARGNEWDHRALRQMLKQPRLAGWRVHKGEVARDGSGAHVRGVWQPLVDDDTYERLRGVMSARSGSGGRRGAHKYLLSGLARCGVCGGRMYGAVTPTGHTYSCRGGNGRTTSHSLTIAGLMTDETVAAVVVGRLALGGPLDAPPAPEWPGADRLAAIPPKIAEVMAAYSAGHLSGAVAFPQVTALEREQAELAVEHEEWRARNAPTAGPTQVDPAMFDVLDLPRRRAVCQRLLEAVVIAPSQRGARWSEDRITYVWKVEPLDR
jgi:site-specific DNA recombinase